MIKNKNTYVSVAKQGNKILHRFVDENGNKHNEKVTYKPTLFTKSKDEYKHKDLHGNSMQPHKFYNMWEASQFINQYKDVDGIEVGGMDNHVLAYLGDVYRDRDLQRPDGISILIYDIETEFVAGNGFPFPDLAAHRINAVSVYSSLEDKYWVLGLGPDTWESDECEYRAFDTETALLENFIELWRSIDPDIISGWNIDTFDNPYIYNRITSILGQAYADSLSPWGIVKKRMIRDKFGKDKEIVDFTGIASFDYIQLYQKFTFTVRENYKLDTIAHIELGDNKISYDEHADLMQLYENDYHKFLEYNLKDTQLVKRLDDALGLMDIGINFSYMVKVPFDKVFGTVTPIDAWIYNYCLANDIIVPRNSPFQGDASFMGGYVSDPVIGRHDWIISSDLTSLYPSIIRALNISPEMKIGHRDGISIDALLNKEIDLRGIDYTISASGVMYDRSKQGMIPHLIEGLFKERKWNKGKMFEAQREVEKLKSEGKDYSAASKQVVLYDNAQMTRKITLNSIFGSFGSVYFRYFDLDAARSITHTGQLIVKWMSVGMEQFFQGIVPSKKKYCYYIDTDSNYFDVTPLVNKMLPNESLDQRVEALARFSSDKMEPKLNEVYDELMDYLNVADRCIAADREIIGTQGIWVSKKRYAVRVHDNEGVRLDTPKLKIMGLDIIKSSTPSILRDKLKGALEMMMDSDNNTLISYIDKIRDDYKDYTIEDIGMPKSVSYVDKYIDLDGGLIKGTPINSRAAIIHNRLLIEGEALTEIGDGDKMIYVFLKTPNPYHSNVIAFKDGIPSKFDSKWIDRDVQFEKSFIKPLQLMLKAVNWNHEKKADLSGFFG